MGVIRLNARQMGPFIGIRLVNWPKGLNSVMASIMRTRSIRLLRQQLYVLSCLWQLDVENAVLHGFLERGGVYAPTPRI